MHLIQKKIYQLIIISLFLFGLFPTRLYAYKEREVENTNILIIDSYNNTNSWSSKLIPKFIHELEELRGGNINLEIEYLNSSLYNSEEYYKEFIELLNSKYKNFNPDLLGTLGNSGLEIMKEEVLNQESIFYEVPILFSGASINTVINEEEKNHVTGILYDSNITKIVNLIKENHKDIEKIKFIQVACDLENTPEFGEEFNSVKKVYAKQLELEFMWEIYIEDIIQNLKEEKDSNYAIIIGNNYISRETQTVVFAKKIIEQIKLVSNAPIYTYDENYVGKGVIGGVAGRAEREGIELAKMANTILEEQEFPEIRIGENDYIFDYEQIYINNLQVSKIPQNSILINRPKFQFLLPRSMKYIMRSLILGILGLIAYLFYYIYRQRQAVKKSKKLYEQTKLQAQIKTDFIAGISHDLKTPINVIRSSVQLLESIDEEIEREYLINRLKVITQNSNKLLRLVNNLVDTVKLEDESCYQMKFEYVNIVEVVEDICLGALDYMQQREIEFIFDTEDEEIFTVIDIEKIERVILNLLSNAIKFTPKSGKINASMEKVEGYVKIRIQDSGIGIASDKLEQIFMKFYSIDNELVKSGEGSGIGLYIVKRLIDLHEGEITVESLEGKGTGFTITLPIKNALEDAVKKSRVQYEGNQIVQLELSDL